tara:strand:- start:342 stop:1250 length:909 start_codon:yes stop_codon:yes gene_type:complete
MPQQLRDTSKKLKPGRFLEDPCATLAALQCMGDSGICEQLVFEGKRCHETLQCMYNSCYHAEEQQKADADSSLQPMHKLHRHVCALVSCTNGEVAHAGQTVWLYREMILELISFVQQWVHEYMDDASIRKAEANEVPLNKSEVCKAAICLRRAWQLCNFTRAISVHKKGRLSSYATELICKLLCMLSTTAPGGDTDDLSSSKVTEVFAELAKYRPEEDIIQSIISQREEQALKSFVEEHVRVTDAMVHLADLARSDGPGVCPHTPPRAGVHPSPPAPRADQRAAGGGPLRRRSERIAQQQHN